MKTQTVITCIGLLMGIFKNDFRIPDMKIISRSGHEFQLRKATKDDVSETTNLIRRAYSYWPEHGVNVGPAKQTTEKTKKHLPKGGFVLEDSAGNIIGTFTLENGSIKLKGEKVVAVYTNPADTVEYKHIDSEGFTKGKYLVFKKLAVDPDLKREGLGRKLYEVAENYGRRTDYKGMLLETVIEAEWLYNWYIDMGFKVIGNLRYQSSEIETLLLIKEY